MSPLRSAILSILVLAALCMVCGFGGGSSDNGAAVARKLPLGGDGRWDDLFADSSANRLYISRATRFMVVDPQNRPTGWRDT